MPDWLTRLEIDLEQITTEAAREHWPGTDSDSEPYHNYRLEHVLQVERDARRLLSRVGGDEDIVLAAVWIHDRFQSQYDGDCHATGAADWAGQNLPALGFPVKKIAAVAYAVANHSSAPGTIPSKAKEARILWDADKLSKVGALAVVGLLCASPAFPDTRVSYEWVSRTIRCELETARELIEWFYFKPSREWASQRYEAQKAFSEALERELGGQSLVDGAFGQG